MQVDRTVQQVDQWFINARKRDPRRAGQPSFGQKRAAAKAKSLAQASQGAFTEEEALRVSTVPTVVAPCSSLRTPEPPASDCDDAGLRDVSRQLSDAVDTLSAAQPRILSSDPAIITPGSSVDLQGDTQALLRDVTQTTTTADALQVSADPHAAMDAAEVMAERADRTMQDVVNTTDAITACRDALVSVRRAQAAGGVTPDVVAILLETQRRVSEVTEGGQKPPPTAMRRLVEQSRGHLQQESGVWDEDQDVARQVPVGSIRVGAVPVLQGPSALHPGRTVSVGSLPPVAAPQNAPAGLQSLLPVATVAPAPDTPLPPIMLSQEQ